MTEKEKMLAGKIYDPFGGELSKGRSDCHRLCMEYNQIPDTETEKRERILDVLLPNRGKGVYLQGPIQLDYGTNIVIGENSYANFNFTALDTCPIIIGKNVFMGPNVSLLTPKHPLCPEDRNSYYNKDKGYMTDQEYGAPIKIGDNCWLAGNVVVCAGVTIGEGCVIGAGSVVTRDIPPHSFACGNPCRVKREIAEEDRLSHHPELF